LPVLTPQEQSGVAQAAEPDRVTGTAAPIAGVADSVQEDSFASTVLSELQEQTARLDRQRQQQEKAALERQRHRQTELTRSSLTGAWHVQGGTNTAETISLFSPSQVDVDGLDTTGDGTIDSMVLPLPTMARGPAVAVEAARDRPASGSPVASVLAQAAVAGQHRNDGSDYYAAAANIGSGRQYSPIELYTPPSERWTAVPQPPFRDGEASVRSLSEAQDEVTALREMLDAMLAKAPARRSPVISTIV
jgi:hypothetical protein